MPSSTPPSTTTSRSSPRTAPRTGGPSRRWARRSRAPTGRCWSRPAWRVLAPGRSRPRTTRRRPTRLSARVRAGGTLALAAAGVHASVVRLAPSVHGIGDHGFVPHADRARAREGRVGLYRRRLEPLAGRASAGCGAALSAGARTGRRTSGRVITRSADEGVPFTAIAEVIGRRLGRAVVADIARKTRPRISAGSPGSPAWICRLRARRRGPCSAGNRNSRACSPTSISPAISQRRTARSALEQPVATVYRRKPSGCRIRRTRPGRLLR